MAIDPVARGLGAKALSDVSSIAGAVRAEVRYSPESKADGALAATGTFDTGQPFTTFASPTGPAPLRISGGRIVHTPFAGAQSAGYLQVQTRDRVTRVGCEVAWPSASVGVAAIVIPSLPWSEGVLPPAGFHLVATGNGIWTLTRFTTGGSTTIADYQTYGRPSDIRGQGLVPLDIWFDPPNNRAVICWWDGTRSVITNAFIGSETSNYAIFELFENNGSTDTPAEFGDLWVDDTTVDYNRSPNLPIFQRASTAPARYNVSGTLNPDFTKARRQEVTLVGNVTSMAFVNVPDNEPFELQLIQDATGSRTLSGANSAIRWAGGVAPTLTTTAGRRDIFTFRQATAGVFMEISRSMNVGN